MGIGRYAGCIVIVNSASEFSQALNAGRYPADLPAVPRGVFMVEPADFHVSSKTSLDNRYLDTEQYADPDRAFFQYRQVLMVSGRYSAKL